MPKKLLAPLCLLLLTVVSFAQTETTFVVPVKWEAYNITDKNLSLSLPKMPILVTRKNICYRQETSQYAAYAGGTVYGLNIVFASNEPIPDYCPRENKTFGEADFSSRLTELKEQVKTTEETKLRLNGLEAVKIEDAYQTYWLINDFKNKRWFELWVNGDDKTKPEIKAFIESIRFEKNPAGIDVGAGSPRTLGDLKSATDTTSAAAANTENNTAGTMTAENKPLRIILKPRASYTEPARRNQTAGVVRLRVTFLASGGIGTVAPMAGLPDGLTEQAVAAAQKIVFIPQRVNDKPVTVSKQVEYSFSIY